jgi:hypothetical protein
MFMKEAVLLLLYYEENIFLKFRFMKKLILSFSFYVEVNVFKHSFLKNSLEIFFLMLY